MNISRYTEISSAARALPPRASEPGGPRRPSRTPPPMPDLPVLDDEDLAFELEVVQPDDEEGIEESERPSVLITGAAGRIGRTLRAAWADRYDLLLIDARPDPDDRDLIVIDLAEPTEDWFALFEGADAVIHLAANADPSAAWADLIRPNIDALVHVLNASALAAIDRFVFASTSHVLAGYRHESTEPLHEDSLPLPDGPYGWSKLIGERLCRAHAASFRFETVVLRLGLVQRGPDDGPERLPDAWARSLWLSSRDLVRLFERALWADLEPPGFVLANGASNNTGGRWPVDRARSILGYEPRDDAFAAQGE